MQKRTLGTSDLELTVIGLGTWAIGGGDWAFGWGPQDDQESIDCIVRAVDLGVNWIDTAAVYGHGQSERLVGKAIGQIDPAQRPMIATKCGRTSLADGGIGKSLQRDSVIAECEASLKRLGVDCIDLYQMHWPEPDEEIEEGWQTLVDLKKQGKVRHIGVSNHSVGQMERLQAIHPIASLQPPYSMMAREVETEILPYCGQQNIGVIAYSPMGKGMLTGAFNADRVASLDDSDHRSRDPRFQAPQLQVNLDFVAQLSEIASGLGWTLPEIAIAWVMRRPELTAAIVGTRRPEQIEQTVVAGTRSLDDATIAAIDTLLKQRDDQLASLSGVQQARV
ncbi:MAG: aldo/keto reductase [Pirellulaceae bacterium]|nr:aldo/keto reductase [Pirellulaceae bacterium]